MSLVLCGNLSALGAPKTGTIIFGNNGTIINDASVIGEDNLGNKWTITTVGTTSFTPNTNWNQVGKRDEPATSITFTMTLGKTANIQSLSAKFGGYSNTAGSITLKIDNETVGGGSLNGTNDVTVSSNQSKQGQTITVTVTNIVRAVNCYNISYTYEESTECYTVTLDDENETLTETQPGSGVTLPSREDVEDYKFYGWTTTDIPEETTNAPASIIPAGNYYPESNITLYPVYRRSENGVFTLPVTVSTTIEDYAANNEWKNATKYTTVILDNVITANVSGGGNTGRYYKNGNNWRLYQNESAALTISAAENYKITAATISFIFDKTGTLTYNGSALVSGTEISVSGENNNSIVFSVGNSENATNGQIRITAISVTYTTDVKIYYTSHPVVPQTAEVAISSVEYRTYVTAFDVDFTQTAGLTAYVVESAERGENGIKYVEVTSVPANTPVILNGTEGTYTIHEGEYTGEEITNVLNTGPVTVDDDNYGTIFVLNTGTNGVGFYLLNNGRTLSEGKCYLEILKNGTDDGAKFVGFHIGDATGISSVVNPTAERNVVYNLAGQRVVAPTKGLYIVNGKKVFIK